jgi:hypothetical protein
MREMTGSVRHFITRQSSHTWKYPNFSSRKVGNKKLLLKVKIPDKPSIFFCYWLSDVKPVGQSWAQTMEKPSDSRHQHETTTRQPGTNNFVPPTATPDNQQSSLDIEPAPDNQNQQQETTVNNQQN